MLYVVQEDGLITVKFYSSLEGKNGKIIPKSE
jgi:hypothetical protein